MKVGHPTAVRSNNRRDRQLLGTHGFDIQRDAATGRCQLLSQAGRCGAVFKKLVSDAPSGSRARIIPSASQSGIAARRISWA